MAFDFGSHFFSMFRGFQTSRVLEELLDKEDTTLEQILAEDDVIQEVRSSNSKLIEFLNEERLETMFEFITVEPTDAEDTNRAYKFPFTVSEIFSCENPTLTERIVSSESLLQKLFSFFRTEDGVNLTLASYTSKTTISLLSKHKQYLSSFLLDDQKFGLDMVKHIYSKTVSELVGMLIAYDEVTIEPFLPAVRIAMLDAVIEQLGNENGPDSIINAESIIIDLISRSEGINGWSLLVSRLICPEMLNKLYGYLSGDNLTSIKCTTKILNAIILHPSFSDMTGYNYEQLIAGELPSSSQDEDTVVTDDPTTPAFVEALIEHLPNMTRVLKLDPKSKLPMTNNQVIEPLGEIRLRTVEFITSLISVNLDSLNKAICDSQLLVILTDLFFTYSWNSSLHVQYDAIVQKILSGEQSDLKTQLLGKCELPKKLIQLFTLPDVAVGERCYRSGNLGFAIRLANAIVKMQSELTNPESVCEGWDAFVDDVLTRHNEVENLNIGGYKPFSFQEEEQDDMFAGLTLGRYNNENQEKEKDDDEDEEEGDQGMIIDDDEDPMPNPTEYGEMSIADLCCSTEALKLDADEEMNEYNANTFWKPDIIDVDDLEELD